MRKSIEDGDISWSSPFPCRRKPCNVDEACVFSTFLLGSVEDSMLSNFFVGRILRSDLSSKENTEKCTSFQCCSLSNVFQSHQKGLWTPEIFCRLQMALTSRQLSCQFPPTAPFQLLQPHSCGAIPANNLFSFSTDS